MNDPTHTHVVTLDDNQMNTLRLALADAVELQTESVDSYCADCELSAHGVTVRRDAMVTAVAIWDRPGAVVCDISQPRSATPLRRPVRA